MAVRSRRRTPFLPHKPEEEPDLETLTEALLAELPEVEPRDPPPFPYAQPEPPETSYLLDALEAEAHEALTAQFARIRDALTQHAADLERRLADANAAIEALREENARLLRANDLFERAFDTLKDVTSDVEGSR